MAVVERGPLLGRAQEWNISKKEMEELVRSWRGQGLCLGLHAGLALPAFAWLCAVDRQAHPLTRLYRLQGPPAL